MDPNTQTPQTPATEQPVSAVAQPQQTVAPVPERNRALEMVIPINRSGLSIAAGYVALFNIPFVIMAPIGIVLGVLGLHDIKQNPGRAGKGRCWFAIVYGSLTILLIAVAILVSTAKY